MSKKYASIVGIVVIALLVLGLLNLAISKTPPKAACILTIPVGSHAVIIHGARSGRGGTVIAADKVRCGYVVRLPESKDYYADNPFVKADNLEETE